MATLAFQYVNLNSMTVTACRQIPLTLIFLNFIRFMFPTIMHRIVIKTCL